MKRLNLGCENEYKEGWVNLDFDKNTKADIYHDLNKYPYPFEKDAFDEVLASMILEHLDNPLKSIKELYKISKHKCKIYISVPYANEIISGLSDLSHKNKFTYHTFGEWFVNKEIYPMFRIIKKKIVFNRVNVPFLNKLFNPIINSIPIIYERFFANILPASTIVYILEVRKDKKFKDQKLKYLRKMEYNKTIDNYKFIKAI